MLGEPGCKFSILASNKAVATQSLRYTDIHASAMIHLGLSVSVDQSVACMSSEQIN